MAMYGLGALGIGLVGAASYCYLRDTEADTETWESVSSQSEVSEPASATPSMAQCQQLYAVYQSHLAKPLERVKRSLHKIDPALVGEVAHSLLRKVYLYVFGWLIRWWHRGAIAELHPQYQALQQEQAKQIETEAAFDAWRKATPKEVRAALTGEEQALIDTLKKSLDPPAPPAAVARRSQEELEREYAQIKQGDERLQGVTEERREWIDGHLIVQGLDVNQVRFQCTVGPQACLHVQTDLEEVCQKGCPADLIKKTVLPQSVQAHVRWSDGYCQLFYAAPQEGVIDPRGVGRRGRKDMEHSRFVVHASLVYRITNHRLEIEGEGMRLGFSALEYNKILRNVPNGLKFILTSLLNTTYQSGIQLTLNLKRLGVISHLGKEKMEIVFERNHEHLLPVDRGDLPQGRIDKHLSAPMKMFMDFDEFQDSFQHLVWRDLATS